MRRDRRAFASGWEPPPARETGSEGAGPGAWRGPARRSGRRRSRGPARPAPGLEGHFSWQVASVPVLALVPAGPAGPAGVEGVGERLPPAPVPGSPSDDASGVSVAYLKFDGKRSIFKI